MKFHYSWNTWIKVEDSIKIRQERNLKKISSIKDAIEIKELPMTSRI